VTTRAAFEASLGFALDPFQVTALDALDAGRSVLVAAPTGSGKTLVAEYAVEQALASGAKAFYTTPIKALSNQKFGDLRARHGVGRVGLLTGDNSIDGEAPVVVMTTEVLRNMIYQGSPTLEGLAVVVLDEVHYLQNPERGAVWEEVIIHLDASVRLVCLSATVSNAEEVGDWLETVRGETEVVIEERRPVALQQHFVYGDRRRDEARMIPLLVGDDLRPNPEGERLSRDAATSTRHHRSRPFTPDRVDVIEVLRAADMLPAISFIFSRGQCDAAVKQCVAAGLRLVGVGERAELHAIAERHLAGLSDDELAVLGVGPWLAALDAGVAAHHAGVVPPMKEAVEEAFAAGLLPVVFATETLALGINMPARTVVIERLTKFTGTHHDMLTPGEFTQLTGRAGRRGIDALGHAVVLWDRFVRFDVAATLASARTYELTSSFRPTYHMAVNLVRRHDRAEAQRLLTLSFAQYRSDRDLVVRERQAQRLESDLARARERAHCELGDVAAYHRELRERRGQGSPHRRRRALAGLAAGDVVLRGRARVVVLQRVPATDGEVRLLALTAGGKLIRLGSEGFNGPPVVVGKLELPTPVTPRNQAWVREVAQSLRKARLLVPAAVAVDDVVPHEATAVASCPDLADHLRALDRVERLERDLERVNRHLRRDVGLAGQLDRVLDVLDRRGYVDGWSLTPAGELLAELATEADLVVAEALRTGQFTGLDAAELAAVVSCCTFQARGPEVEEPAASVSWPTHEVRRRWQELDRLWRSVRADEQEAGVPETRRVDPGFVEYAWAWAAGNPLDHVLDDDLGAGDFVRNVKQLIDVLRQVGDLAPDAPTARTARAAVDALFRGVVAASTRLGS
jgi:ATP-dependent RNA helicase HelY